MILVFMFFESILYLICTTMIQCTLYDCVIKKRLYFPIAVVTYCVFAFLMILDVEYHIFSILITLLNFLIIKLCLKNAKLKSILFNYLFLYTINVSLHSSLVFILDKSENLFLKDFLCFIITVITLISFIILCKLQQNTVQSYYKMIPSNVKKVIFLSVISSCFLIGFFSEATAFENLARWSAWVRITSILFLLFMGAVIPVLIANSIGKSFYLNQSHNFEKQIEIQAKHYAGLVRANKEMQTFRHDYKNLYLSVFNLLQEGKINDASEILKQNAIKLDTITKQRFKFNTGSPIVDAILTEKENRASDVGAKIVFDGSISVPTEESSDLCAIFGNALDNAIEACEKVKANETKIINVSCNCKSGFFFLTVTNPVEENITIKNNFIPSSKPEKSKHGFGLNSMQKITKEHNGVFNISCNDKVFCLEIEMDIKERKRAAD